MKLRARHIHAIESLVDNIVGLGINMVLTQLIFNVWLGQDVSFHQNVQASCVFFVFSYIRKYTLRRWSSNYIQKIYEKRKLEEAA